MIREKRAYYDRSLSRTAVERGGTKRPILRIQAVSPKPTISFADFAKVDLRVGTVIRAEPFPEARKPAIKLWINFGDDLGELKTSAQITDHYTPERLMGRQVIGVVNFEPKQIGSFMSECLIIGAIDTRAAVTLLAPDSTVKDGLSIA